MSEVAAVQATTRHLIFLYSNKEKVASLRTSP
jgi:hypothetical protein